MRRKQKTGEPGRPKKPGGKRQQILNVSDATREKIKKTYGTIETWGQAALEKTGIIKSGEDF